MSLDFCIDHMEERPKLVDPPFDFAPMLFEHFDSLGNRNVTVTTESREPLHVNNRHAGRFQSNKERNPRDIRLGVDTMPTRRTR